MSHDYGEVIVGNKVVGHFEYDGTYAISHIYDTKREVSDNWRSGRRSECKCGNQPIKAILYSRYGHGFYWDGKVCLKCRSIVEGCDPYRYEILDEDAGYSSGREIVIGPTDGCPFR